MKKQQTIISAEEQHLAEMSTSSSTTTTTTVKKVKKLSNKSILKKSISSAEEKTIAQEIKTESTILQDTQVTKSNELKKHPEEEKHTHSLLLEDQAKKVLEMDTHESKKKTKSKKVKKTEAEKQSISVKSSFSKFDALQKRNLIHVRSNDKKFSEDKKLNCKLCLKPVYKMEEVKAEKNVYHKNCFRCYECNKQLKYAPNMNEFMQCRKSLENLWVDNYQSHEGHPYCMIHFKLLFAPKVIEETEPDKPRKSELIIRENDPVDLPPDVVRASDIPDLGLEDLHQLNVRSRYQIFEKGAQQQIDEKVQVSECRPANVKHSTTILSKVAKLQAHGFNGSIDGENILADLENSSSEHEDSSSNIEENVEDVDLVRSKKRTRERPVGIGKAMNDIKTKFEKGPSVSKDERREERKQEIQNIRSRLFMGKQARIKEMYQQAVADSEQGIVSTGKKPEIEVDGVTRSLKERFEKGEIFRSDQTDDSSNVLIHDGKLEDIKDEASKISQKFKFFETYRPIEGERKQFRITPPRAGVVKLPSPDNSDQDQPIQGNEETNLLEKSRTTAKMLDRFREMEKNKNKSQDGPRPLKCFTPPPDGGKRLFQSDDTEEENGENSDDSSEEDEEDDLDEETKDAMKRAKLLADDEALKEAQAAARAKQLRIKFEKWEADEIKREMHDSRVDIYSQTVSDETNIESTKSIRERFENMKTAEARTPIRPRYQVNRFV